MRNLCVDVLETQKVVGHLGGSSHLRGPIKAEHQQVHDQPVVLDDKGGELQAANDAVAVGVVHILVVDDDVVFGGHVVGNVVVDNQSQQPVEQGQVDLFVELFKVALHHDVALAVARLPNILISKLIM